MKKIFVLVAFVLLTGAESSGGCGGSSRPPPLENWSFDRWTDTETLTAWVTERGSVERLPTWHEADRGVSFVGDDVLLFQESMGVAACTRFEFVVFADPGVEARFRIDYTKDGTYDVDVPLPSNGDWTPVRQDVSVGNDRHIAARYELVKSGEGRFYLGQARGRAARDCAGVKAEPPVGGQGEHGAACYSYLDCKSYKCDDNMCTQ